MKSILDIGRTLEFLETQGVPVVTFGSTDEFPAFFSPRCRSGAGLGMSFTGDVARLTLSQYCFELMQERTPFHGPHNRSRGAKLQSSRNHALPTHIPPPPSVRSLLQVCARMLRAADKLDLRTGAVFAVPIPAENSPDGEGMSSRVSLCHYLFPEATHHLTSVSRDQPPFHSFQIFLELEQFIQSALRDAEVGVMQENVMCWRLLNPTCI